jgi:opacity protein-like surface antigen
MKKILLLLLFPAVVLAGTEPTVAVDETARTSDSPWRFRITPYAWLPSTSGSVGAGPLSADAGVSASKIISKLQIGAMLDVEVDYERWSLENDLVYASLESSTDKTQPSFGELKTTAYQLFWTSYLGYRVIDTKPFTMDLQGGFRLISLGLDGELTPGLLPGRSRTWTRTWVDPVVGLRTRTYLTHWLFLPIRGDIGGFGANSELTWQALAGVGAQVSRWFALVVGYRAIGYHYDQAGFRYDVNTHGPIVGLNFEF